MSAGKPVLLVLGGSLGSQAINRAIVRILPRLLERFFVIHQTGQANMTKRVRVLRSMHSGDASGKIHGAFFDTGELSDAFALADLIVSRAGRIPFPKLQRWGSRRYHPASFGG